MENMATYMEKKVETHLPNQILVIITYNILHSQIYIIVFLVLHCTRRMCKSYIMYSATSGV